MAERQGAEEGAVFSAFFQPRPCVPANRVSLKLLCGGTSGGTAGSALNIYLHLNLNPFYSHVLKRKPNR
jgi:hypothetical protein